MVIDMAFNLSHRVKTLLEDSAKQAAHVSEPQSMHFQVAVSCPPSTVLHIRGGNVWESSYWGGVGYGYYIAADTADFSDVSTIEGYSGNFSTAGYYIGVIFGRGFYGEDWFCLSSGTEFATAAEAEVDIEDVTMLDSPWRGYDFNGGLPLVGLVLRNDGRTAVDGAILPIDRVNRGRSYYWKDLRPRHYVEAPT